MKTFKQLVSIIKEDDADSSDAFNALDMVHDYLSSRDCYIAYFRWSHIAPYAVFDNEYQNFIKLKDDTPIATTFRVQTDGIIKDITQACEPGMNGTQILLALKNSPVLVFNFTKREGGGKVILSLDKDKTTAKLNEFLNDKNLFETEIKKVPDWKKKVTRLEVAYEQTEESDSFESMFNTLDDVYSDYIERGIIPLKDVPSDKLDEYFRKKGININNKELTGLEILKKIKPRGILAGGYLQKFGKPINLKIGKFKILDRNCYLFDYEFAKVHKILSKPTITNLEMLKKHFKFNHKTVYVTLSYPLTGDWRPRYTFVVTGERNGIPYAYVRKETGGEASGQTKLYGPKSLIRANYITWPTFQEYDQYIETHPELQERFGYKDFVHHILQNGYSGEALQTREQQLKDIGL